MEKVWVQPSPTIKGRVALWDKDPAYEGGELWIAWGASDEPPAPVLVPLTPAVSAGLARRTLVQCEPPKRAARPKKTPRATSGGE
ncbi:MAG: hypothetical protein ACYSVY_00055 [Planctomycetota bacterium]|jgi:hypothetical protein